MVMVNINPCLHTTITISPLTKVVFPRGTSERVKKNPGRPQVYFHMIYKLFTYAYSDYEVNMNFHHIKGQHLKIFLFLLLTLPLLQLLPPTLSVSHIHAQRSKGELLPETS